MMRYSQIAAIAATGCSHRVDQKQFEAAIQRVDKLPKESEQYRVVAAQLNTTVNDGTKTISQALVESSKEFGTAIDPLGIKHLLGENERLRARVHELEATLRLRSGESPGVLIHFYVDTRNLLATIDSHQLVKAVTREPDGLYTVHFKKPLNPGYVILVSTTAGFANVTVNKPESVRVAAHGFDGKLYTGDCEFFIVVLGSVAG
jgi:hypothetical protein